MTTQSDNLKPQDAAALEHINAARAQHEMPPLLAIKQATRTELLWGLRLAAARTPQPMEQSEDAREAAVVAYFCDEASPFFQQAYNAVSADEQQYLVKTLARALSAQKPSLPPEDKAVEVIRLAIGGKASTRPDAMRGQAIAAYRALIELIKQEGERG